MKIALIGFGNIGKIHLNVILSSTHQLVGICDIDEDKLIGFENELRFTDYKKMLDEVKPDIVHICTPHHLHKEMIIYALKNEINVFCEKPICINKREIDEIQDVLNNCSVQLGVCYQNRYNPSTIFIKNYLKGKEIILVEGELKWHRDAKYYSQSYWRGKKEYEGGGVLINQAIHTIDLMQYIGFYPSEICAKISNISLKGIIDVEDNAVVTSTDQRFKLTASNSCSKDYPVKIKIKTDDELIVIESNKVLINDKVYECEKLNLIGNAKEIYGGGHACIIKDFYYKVENKIKFDIDFYESIKSLKIVLASYQSQGKKVKVV